MRHVRQDRKAIELLKSSGKPAIYAWTGNLAFKRTRGKRFNRLSHMLRDEEFLQFCAAIGWVEVNWAIYEAQLMRWCQVTFVVLKWRGILGKDKEMPRQYGRMYRFLKDAFAKVPALSPFKAECLEILARGDSLSETRHDLTHATITQMQSKDGKWTMENRRARADGRHTVKEVVFNMREFPAISEKLAVLGRDALHISDRIYKTFVVRS